jgi:SET domain-containing protein
MKTYLPRSWISPKLVPGPSAIHGVGVIAAAPVKKGEKLMEFGGETISPADFETDVYRLRSIWQVGEGVYLALREDDPEPSLDENLNHSCAANSWLTDEVTLAARRDIEAGEEITLDQGTWNFDEDEYVWDQDHCSCGSAACRRVLTQHDWKRRDVQERYRGHFHPYLRRLMEPAASE